MSINALVNLKSDFIRANLEKPLVVIGLMGAGKTSIGNMLADELGYGFVDSDDEIVKREGRSIPEIFAQSGEPHFREVERDVIQDLMRDTNPHVIGTGGGAFMNDQTRQVIKEAGLSVFLKADLDVLVKRVGSGEGRPLLMAGNPREILQELINKRYPIYQEADLIVETRDESPQETLARVSDAIYNKLSLS
ncbi:MAG TPA: shikimate kinase [Alphaproteobacteria bacterium]|nr:shikimate kinase [Alphaproteobacteria bacterium]